MVKIGMAEENASSFKTSTLLPFFSVRNVEIKLTNKAIKEICGNPRDLAVFCE